MNFLKTVAIAATGCLVSFAANATTIDFDGTSGDGGTQHSSGGPSGSYYATADFIFSPSNLTGATHCDEGKCVQEFKNGDVGVLTRKNPVEEFDLDSFYFNLTGMGSDEDNFLVATAYNGVAVVDTLVIALTDLLSGILTDVGVSVGVAFHEHSTGAACKDDDKNSLDELLYVCKNKGYTVAMNGAFDGATSVEWTASESAQLRIDTIGISPIPLPAGALLLLTGLAGLGVARKRAA